MTQAILMPRLIHITTVADSFVFMRGQLAYIKERGFEIHGISSPGPLVDGIVERENIVMHTVEMPRKITPARDLLAVAELVKIIRRVDPDIVHSHTPKAGLLGMFAARLAGVDARVYHMRGLPMETATGYKRLLLAMSERVSCAIAQRVITVGESLRQTAIAEGLCPPEKISVMASGSSNGVDGRGRFNPERLPVGTGEEIRQRLGIPLQAEVIGFVGRLVRDKGIIEIVEAWQKIRETHRDVHLLLIGPFEERDAVSPRIRHILEEDQRIHLPGYVDDTPSHYAAMDILTLPTYREGFPNSVLEGAAMGLPVVASDIGPCREAVAHGQTGINVAVADAQALAAGWERYLEDAELRRRHGEAGRRRVLEEFDPQRIWEGIAQVYEELLRQSAQ